MEKLEEEDFPSSPVFSVKSPAFTKSGSNNRYHILCLTLLPFESPPSESWPHTLRAFSSALQLPSSQPATVFKISGSSPGYFSFICSNPSDLMTPAKSPDKKPSYQAWEKLKEKKIIIFYYQSQRYSFYWYCRNVWISRKGKVRKWEKRASREMKISSFD